MSCGCTRVPDGSPKYVALIDDEDKAPPRQQPGEEHGEDQMRPASKADAQADKKYMKGWATRGFDALHAAPVALAAAALFLDPFPRMAQMRVPNLAGLPGHVALSQGAVNRHGGAWSASVMVTRDGPPWLAPMPRPLWPARVARLSGAVRRARQEFWVSYMAFSGAVTLMLGTLLIARSRCGAALEASEPVVPRGYVGEKVRSLCRLAVACHLLVVMRFVIGGAITGSLAPSSGLLFESWATILWIGQVWLLVQAIVLPWLRVNARYGSMSFFQCSLATVGPFIADPYDTLKDAMLAGFCFQAGTWPMRVLGVAVLAYLVGFHCYMLRDPSMSVELEASYCSVLKLSPLPMGSGQQRKRPFDQVLVFLFKQTTPERRRALIIEDTPQGIFALLYLVQMGQFPFVVIVNNLALPLGRLLFAHCMYPVLAPMAANLLVEQCDPDAVASIECRRRLAGEFLEAAGRGGSSLAEAVLRSSSQELKFDGVGLGDVGASALAAVLERNRSVLRLSLQGNGIGASGAEALASALQCATALIELSLLHNCIGEAGARHLAEALEANSTLQELDVYRNQIGDGGVEVLASVLEGKNATLNMLRVGGDDIRDDSARALARMLSRNSTLKSLIVRDSGIGDAGAAVLASALEANASLKWLNVFGGPNMGDKGKASLKEAAARKGAGFSLFI